MAKDKGQIQKSKETRAQKRARMRPAEYASEAVAPFWPLFVEKLLLAIIDANPQPIPNTRKTETGETARLSEDERREIGAADRISRLTVAMDALFLHGTKGRQPARDAIQNLPLTLEWQRRLITDQFVRRQFGGYGKVNRAPAIKIENLNLPADPPLVPPGKLIDFLSLPRSWTSKKKQSRARSFQKFLAKHGDYISLVAWGHESEEESAIWRDLSQVAAILEKWNVDARLDTADLGLLTIAPKNGPLFRVRRES